jgi:hypothetical protein
LSVSAVLSTGLGSAAIGVFVALSRAAKVAGKA